MIVLMPMLLFILLHQQPFVKLIQLKLESSTAVTEMLTEGEHFKSTREILKNDEKYWQKISLSVFLSASQTELVSQSKVQGEDEWGNSGLCLVSQKILKMRNISEIKKPKRALNLFRAYCARARRAWARCNVPEQGLKVSDARDTLVWQNKSTFILQPLYTHTCIFKSSA